MVVINFIASKESLHCSEHFSASFGYEYKIVNDTIPVSLTGVPGDPVKGKKLVINRKKGNCLACHAMPSASERFSINHILAADLSLASCTRLTVAKPRPKSRQESYMVRDLPFWAAFFL